MKSIEFKKLLETEPNLKKIIYLHCHLKISLTSQQLDRVLRLKRKKEAELWGRKGNLIES